MIASTSSRILTFPPKQSDITPLLSSRVIRLFWRRASNRHNDGICRSRITHPPVQPPLTSQYQLQSLADAALVTDIGQAVQVVISEGDGHGLCVYWNCEAKNCTDKYGEYNINGFHNVLLNSYELAFGFHSRQFVCRLGTHFGSCLHQQCCKLSARLSVSLRSSSFLPYYVNKRCNQ